MRIRHIALHGFLTASLILVGADVSAQAKNEHSSPLRRYEIRDYKNDASSAAAQAQARYGGKVLKVSKSTSNGRTVYHVKLLLDSGRIKVVTIAE